MTFAFLGITSALYPLEMVTLDERCEGHTKLRLRRAAGHTRRLDGKEPEMASLLRCRFSCFSTNAVVRVYMHDAIHRQLVWATAI